MKKSVKIVSRAVFVSGSSAGLLVCFFLLLRQMILTESFLLQAAAVILLLFLIVSYVAGVIFWILERIRRNTPHPAAPADQRLLKE